MAKDNAQGAHPYSGDQPPTDGPDNKFAYPWGVNLDSDEAGETTVVPGAQGETSIGTPKDPNLAPNKYPRESGSDTYEGIPGNGIIPG